MTGPKWDGPKRAVTLEDDYDIDWKANPFDVDSIDEKGLDYLRKVITDSGQAQGLTSQ